MNSNQNYLIAIIIGVIIIVTFLIISFIFAEKPKPAEPTETSIKHHGKHHHHHGKQHKKHHVKHTGDDHKKPSKVEEKQEEEYIDEPEEEPVDQVDENNESDAGSEPSSDDTPTFADSCVKYHNIFRSKHRKTHSVSNSDKLVRTAQAKANLMARTGDFSHTPNLEMGENLYYFSISSGSGHVFAQMDCKKPSTAWYNEIKDYNYQSPESSNGQVGHFTQMVWTTSKQIGCAKSHNGNSGSIYAVCHYNPAGNYVGTYPQHVMHLK